MTRAVVERIQSVRVFIGGEVGIGDFGDDTKTLARGGRRSEGAYRNANYDPVAGRVKKPLPRKKVESGSKKPRMCGKCGEIGHRRDNCPNSNERPATTEGGGDTANDS